MLCPHGDIFEKGEVNKPPHRIGLIDLHRDCLGLSRTYSQPSDLKWDKLESKFRSGESLLYIPPQPTSGDLLSHISLGNAGSWVCDSMTLLVSLTVVLSTEQP